VPVGGGDWSAIIPRNSPPNQDRNMIDTKPASKLHKLGNGAWIDLRTVKAIIPLPTINASESSIGTTHRARVRVDHGEHGMQIITSNDDEHAQQVADELASLVNLVTDYQTTEPRPVGSAWETEGDV